MKTRSRQRGFSAVELVLVLVLVVLVGAMGYVFYTNQVKKPATNSNDKPQVSQQAAPEINTSDDLTKAERTIDSVNPDNDSSADLSGLDQQTNGL